MYVEQWNKVAKGMKVEHCMKVKGRFVSWTVNESWRMNAGWTVNKTLTVNPSRRVNPKLNSKWGLNKEEK